MIFFPLGKSGSFQGNIISVFVNTEQDEELNCPTCVHGKSDSEKLLSIQFVRKKM